MTEDRHAEAAARDRRIREVLESALADEEFMEATRAGIAASQRGEKGIPLREIQAAERSQRGRGHV